MVLVSLTRYRFSDCADDFSKHKAIQHLSTVVDLIHNCGYISLLKTGKSYTYTPEVTACSTQQTKQSIGQNLDQSAASDTKVSHANQNPSNGINNAECAEVLQSELDSLGRIDERQIPGNVRLGSTKESVASSQVQGSNNSSTSESGVSKHQADRTKLKLDLKDGVKHAESSCEESMESQWLLLDCYFGIPLFGSDINIRVCDKILKKGLCNKNRYAFYYLFVNFIKATILLIEDLFSLSLQTYLPIILTICLTWWILFWCLLFPSGNPCFREYLLQMLYKLLKSIKLK